MSTDERLPTYTIELTEDLPTGGWRVICGWSCERDEVDAEILAEVDRRIGDAIEWLQKKARRGADDE